MSEDYVHVKKEIIEKIATSDPLSFSIWVYFNLFPTDSLPHKLHVKKLFNISERNYMRRIAFLRASGLLEYGRYRHSNGQLGKVNMKILEEIK